MVVSVNRGAFPPLEAEEWGALVLDEYSLQSIVREMGSNPQRQFCFPCLKLWSLILAHFGLWGLPTFEY